VSLLRYTVRRVAQAIPVVLGVVTITFLLTELMPGDPISIMLGPSPSQTEIEAIRARYGFDRPVYVRYLDYMVSSLTGDLGRSLYYQVPVTQKIMERLPVTLYLLLSAFAFAIATAIPLGVISAKRRNKPTDHVSRVVSLIGVSTPSFWIGLIFIIVFAYHLDWFPATNIVMPYADPASLDEADTSLDLIVMTVTAAEVCGAGPTCESIFRRLDVLGISLAHLFMPMVSLGTLQMAALTRIERSQMLEELSKDYVRLARAYGVSERKILRKHAFRPAQLPLVTIIGLQLTAAIGGAVLTETVFSINGMGTLIITGINNQDFPLIMGTTMVFGLIFVIGVILTDISYAYIDPRVTYGEQG
jgi:peptide/nickel transport system permease protein